MNVSPHHGTWMRGHVALAAICLAVALNSPARCQETEAAAAVDEAVADPFAVPDGTPDELLKFVEAVADPKVPYSTREEIRKVADAITTATERMLADDSSTDFHLKEAVEWRIGVLSLLSKLGDRQAEQDIETVLERLKDDPRPVVANNAKHVWLEMRILNWPLMTLAEKQATADELVEYVSGVELELRHVGLVAQLGDMMADTNDRDVITPAFDQLLPLVKDSENAMVAKQTVMLESILRRLNLLDNEMELDGELLGGGTLDWESYRGKVVLVDFFATWCGPCRAEVPNVLANYQMYKDKGFEVLGISLDQTPEDAEEYIEQTGITWETVFSSDPEERFWNAPMAVRYAVNAIPQAFLVDQEGKVVHMNARGPLLSQQLAQLLGPPSIEQTSATVPAEKQTVQD